MGPRTVHQRESKGDFCLRAVCRCFRSHREASVVRELRVSSHRILTAMTKQKHLKALVRARMQKTGESYVVARRHVLRKAAAVETRDSQSYHLPGNIPATTALRILLSASNVCFDQAEHPISEALLFGCAGGIGAGVFAFRYEQEDFSSFFVAGRHLWQDDHAYLESACKRIGVKTEVTETGSKKVAGQQLQDAMADKLPVIAWCDQASLPGHCTPAAMVGGQYHVVTVYDIAEEKVLIGDLADAPQWISLKAFNESRAGIKKQKNRILRIVAAPKSVELKKCAKAGIRECHATLVGKGTVKPPGGKSMAANFTLPAFEKWADLMHGSKSDKSWAKAFPRGLNLWRGLTSIYSFIHYGTGGGLTRPLYAQFFQEVHGIFRMDILQELANRYEDLGKRWDELAEAALPDEVEIFQRFKQLCVARAELTLSQDHEAEDRLPKVVAEMDELSQSARDAFPLDAAVCESLRSELSDKIRALHQDELAAHELLGKVEL